MDDSFDLRSKWRNEKMIKWRNEEILELSTEMDCISDTMATLASLVREQGESLDVAVREVEKAEVCVEEATSALRESARWQDRFRSTVANGAVVVLGTGLGCAGFLVGPVVGTITLAAGVAAAIAFVGVRKVINRP